MTATTIFDTGLTIRCRMMSKRQRSIFLSNYLRIMPGDFLRITRNPTDAGNKFLAHWYPMVAGKQPADEQNMKMLKALYKDYLNDRELSSASMEVPS